MKCIAEKAAREAARGTRGRETGRRAKLGLRFRSLRFPSKARTFGIAALVADKGEMRAPGRVSTVCQIRMLKHCKKIFCYGFLVVKVF